VVLLIPMVRTSEIPRIVTAALRGGAGKTLLTVGLAAALSHGDRRVAVFKKGPDYIDAGWLGLAAGSPCHNLDTFLFSRDVVLGSFAKHSSGATVAVVEGNRGLFDGVDARGTSSTAELAKLLHSPVLLIIDATKMTRTAAALALGCKILDPDLTIGGIILNRVAGARHEHVLRTSIEDATGIPVLGAVPKLEADRLPQRHLGLLPLQEHPEAAALIREAARLVADAVDVPAVLEVANHSGLLDIPCAASGTSHREGAGRIPVRIGIIRDSAFQFYYPENLESLAEGGAELVFVNSLSDSELPELDGLYIGGGFPETHAAQLAGNRSFKDSLAAAVAAGLPVYAECGGLMYLSRDLVLDEAVYPMAGVFPISTVMRRKPQGLGYIRVEVTENNPFYPRGTVVSGHEFHYSAVHGLDEHGSRCAFTVTRGHGMDGRRDGIRSMNALGTYLHVHALGEPLWAKGILAAARNFQSMRRRKAGDSEPQRQKDGRKPTIKPERQDKTNHQDTKAQRHQGEARLKI
jgi:cobyrinic acid a,c-diamide synthase